MSKQSRKYQTQWASQFYVAAELTRRGYLVSLTLGNAPVADLLVVSPERYHFMVDVKGQSTRNFWLIQRREPREDLYFVLVYLPRDKEPPRFFVLRSTELMNRREEYRKHIESTGGKYKDEMGGINWTTAFEYEDRWDILPR
jgi:hypothetical protein